MSSITGAGGRKAVLLGFLEANVAWLAPAALVVGLVLTQLISGLPVALVLGLPFAALACGVMLLRPLWAFYAMVALLSAEYQTAVSGALTGTKIFGVLLFLGWMLEAARGRTAPLSRLGTVFAAPLFLLCASVSMLAAENLATGFSKLATIIQLNLLVLIAATLLRSRRDVEGVAWALVVSTLCSATYGIVASQLGRQAVAEGFATDRNIFGVFVAICVPLLAYFFERVSFAGKLALGGIVMVFGIAEALSFSRGGFLGLVLAAALSLLLVIGRRRMQLAVTVVVVAVAVFMFTPAEYGQRVSHIGMALESGSDTVGLRYQLWKITLRMIADHPLLGVGPGNYFDQFMRYGGIIGLRRSPLISHNTILSVTAELGMLGGAAFVLMVFVSLLTYWRAASSASKRGDPDLAALSRALGIALLVFLAGSLSLSLEYVKYLWLLVGMSAAMVDLAKSAPAATIEDELEVAGTDLNRARGHQSTPESLPERRTR